VVTRHEFLAQLHEQLQPRGYLEIGVQFGESLRLARCSAIGIDPAPMLQGHFKDATVFTSTSDDFFESGGMARWFELPIDLVFIDGMHLYEYALRDFENVERYVNERSVVVFDDVLPRNQHEAARVQCPGDWTGDVWKVPKFLQVRRPRLKQHWVDTQPTGTYVVYGFDPEDASAPIYAQIRDLGLEAWETVPDDVLNRAEAVDPSWALEQIAAHMKELG
jgi:hypothetical protein